MIDHVILNAGDLKSSRRFYERALAPLGYEVIYDLPEAIGFGREGKAGLLDCGPPAAQHRGACRLHVRGEKDGRRVLHTALEAGGKDNGAPGIREQYHPDYYAAFVFDPDGNNIERTGTSVRFISCMYSADALIILSAGSGLQPEP